MKNKNKGKHIKVKHGGGNKPQRQREGSIYDTSASLGPKAFRRAVNKIVRSEVRPILKAYHNQINELQGRAAYDVQKEANLGRQATNNIGNYFDQLAQQEAANLQAQKASSASTGAAVAGANKEALAGIQAAAAAAQKGAGSYSGQDIAARDRLAQMIATQEGAAQREGQADKTMAAETAAGREAMLRALAGSSRMRGQETIGDVNRQVQGNIGKIREGYGEAINKAQQGRNEILEKRPGLFWEALTGLRDKEQNYQLSKAALGIKKFEAKTERQGNKSGTSYAKITARNNLKLTREKHKLRMEEMAKLGATEAERRAEEHRFREKELHWQKIIANSGGGGKNGAGGYQPFGKTYSYLRGGSQHPKQLAKQIYQNKGDRKKAYDKLRRYGASDKVAKNAIKKLIKQYVTGKALRVAKDPNGARLGR